MKNKITIIVFLLLMTVICISAQTITSINPTYPRPGMSLTITGTGFTATGNVVHVATPDMSYEQRMTLACADGSTLSFTVPTSLPPACYYEPVPCGSPSTSVYDGPYMVFVEVAGVKSNIVSFRIAGPPSLVPTAIPTISPPPPSYFLVVNFMSGTAMSQVTVTVDPPGNTTGYPISYTYDSPTTVSVEANNVVNPDGSGYAFVRWEGAVTGSANPATVLVDTQKTLTAYYAVIDPVPTPTTTPVTGCDYITGDANGNGTIDIIDTLIIAQYYVGLNPPTIQLCSSDADRDGTVHIVDALLIAQCYVGLRSCVF